MKQISTFLFILLFPFLSYGQIEDHWAGVCTSLDFEYTLMGTTDPLVYTMTVDIQNIGTDTIFTYCDLYDTPTEGVTLSGSPSCYGELLPNGYKPIEITVTFDNADINCFILDFKVKSGLDDTKYCIESTQFCKNTPLTLEEVNRDDMPYTSVYYDLLGRIKTKPLKKGFYVERRTYVDGFKTVEKIFVNPN